MSQENVEIVRGAFAAFERGDMSHIIDLMADDLVTHRIEPDNAIYHGKEGFFQATTDWTEDFEDWTATAEEFLDAGDNVLGAQHRPSGPVGPILAAGEGPCRRPIGNSGLFRRRRFRYKEPAMI